MKDDIAIIIGHNISKLLWKHEIYQRTLSKILGVSESTVGKWVLGKSVPRMGAIQKMADYFGVKKSDILEANKGELLDKEKDNLINQIRDIDDIEKIERIKKMIELMQ